MFSDDEKRHITPQEAVTFLAEKGLQISEKEAEIILEFMYKIVTLESIQKNSKNHENSRFIHKSKHR